MTYHYPDLSSASDWSCRLGNLLKLIRRPHLGSKGHQYGISETNDGATKMQAVSQASLTTRSSLFSFYTAISRKVVGKNVHATIPKGSMGYDQFTVPDTVAFEPTFVASFSTLRHISMASGAILSNFFEEE